MIFFSCRERLLSSSSPPLQGKQELSLSLLLPSLPSFPPLLSPLVQVHQQLPEAGRVHQQPRRLRHGAQGDPRRRVFRGEVVGGPEAVARRGAVLAGDEAGRVGVDGVEVLLFFWFGGGEKAFWLA